MLREIVVGHCNSLDVSVMADNAVARSDPWLDFVKQTAVQTCVSCNLHSLIEASATTTTLAADDFLGLSERAIRHNAVP